MAYPPTIGVILAGGLARRMGSRDKARIRVGDATILERVIERLRPQCADLIINANTDAARFADTALPSSRTVCRAMRVRSPGFCRSRLDSRSRHTDRMDRECAERLSVPATRSGDAPASGAVGASALIACATSGKRPHPVVAIWPVALREELRRALTREGISKVGEWSARYPLGIAPWALRRSIRLQCQHARQAAEAERLAAQYPQA